METTRVPLIIVFFTALGLLFIATVAPASAQSTAGAKSSGATPSASTPAPTGFPSGPLITPPTSTDMGDTANPVAPGTKIYDPSINYDSYVLGPGDSISVNVMPQDKYSAANLPITQDGSLYYPGLGRVQAAGLTIDQLTATLTTGLTKYCIDPFVTVSLTALRQQVVYVTGDVSADKALDVNAASTLAKAITLAGGAKDSNELSRVVVVRGSQVLPSDMYDLLVRGVDNGQNIALMPGDVVIVPLNTQHFTVLGEVIKPGQLPLEQTGLSNEGPMRLADGIALSGGVMGGSARISRVGLLRQLAGASQPQLFVFDYGKYLKDGDESQNPVLQDNDVIIVPPTRPQVVSFGGALSLVSLYGLFRQLFPR